MKLSSRCTLLEPSPTLAINALAKERAAQGLPVFNLSTGEPDIITPEHIRRAAVAAIEAGATRYTPVGGVKELKAAIAKKMLRDVGVSYTPSHITCANGGKQILYNLFQVILNEGDEVLCFSPYWVSYSTQVALAGGVLKEVHLNAKNNFAFEPDVLARAITKKTVAILINSPSNPTGQVLSEEALRQIADVARAHNVLVITDDVYEYFYYTEKKPSHILCVAPDLISQTIIVNAVSKTYAMTGWRLGYAVGPENIIQKMEELQSHSASNPSSVSQMAAIEALNGPQESVEEMRKSFLSRRNALLKLTEGMHVIVPQGAFYMMIDIHNKKKPGETDLALCLALLKETGVAVIPGESFGVAATGFVRISFANTWEVIHGGIRALMQFRA